MKIFFTFLLNTFLLNAEHIYNPLFLHKDHVYKFAALDGI